MYSYLSRCDPDLQGEGQPDEVHHHLLVGQLHAEQSQQVVEVLVVLPPAALLLAAQVDVAVELLAVLQGEGGENSDCREKQKPDQVDTAGRARESEFRAVIISGQIGGPLSCVQYLYSWALVQLLVRLIISY